LKIYNWMSTRQDKNNMKSKVSEDETTEELNDKPENAQEEEFTDTDLLLEGQQKRINALEEELGRVKDTQLRKAAEMENFKKRLQRERDQLFLISREAAIEAFLPVYDDLHRTLEALEDADADESYLNGIKLVAAKFDEILKRYGVEAIEETGVPFDVDLHDALMRKEPEDDSIESGTVLQVFEKGYKMGDKTLRHAKVIVSE
jgi:molecular chaperone GrpE